MSNFISCMVPGGLSEIPPESNVTALPTSAISGPSPLPAPPVPSYSRRINRASSTEPWATAANAPICASRIADSSSTAALNPSRPASSSA